jgi:hypothetical protein
MQIYTNIDYHVCVVAQYRINFFSQYKLFDEELNVGVSLEHLKNFFKNAKKHDDVIFKIVGDGEAQPVSMQVIIIKDKKLQDIHCENEIKVQIIQSEHLDYSQRISEPIKIKNDDFLSLCRSIQLQPGWIDISFGQKALAFEFNINDITSSVIRIGDKNQRTFDYKERFNANCVKNSNKLANFSNIINVYSMYKQPLVFEATKPECSIKIWIKSNNQIQEEVNK